MNNGWKTLAIGRHLIDVPATAQLIQQWKFNGSPIRSLPIVGNADFERIVARRETELRAARHRKHGSMFVERVPLDQGSVVLVSWASEYSVHLSFDCYFLVGMKALSYRSELVASDRKQSALALRLEMSQRWHEITPGVMPNGIGFVAGDAILIDNDFNPETWDLTIRLSNKPDVELSVSSFAIGKVDQPLRERAGGVVAGMLGLATGLVRLRNRERPVGPIWAEEILVAGTQNGKRAYGFKWEAPGKANSLAEPQLNISLEVGESAYKTNAHSFASDEEALALWDTIVESIRLRPGAV